MSKTCATWLAAPSRVLRLKQHLPMAGAGPGIMRMSTIPIPASAGSCLPGILRMAPKPAVVMYLPITAPACGCSSLPILPIPDYRLVGTSSATMMPMRPCRRTTGTTISMGSGGRPPAACPGNISARSISTLRR